MPSIFSVQLIVPVPVSPRDIPTATTPLTVAPSGGLVKIGRGPGDGPTVTCRITEAVEYLVRTPVGMRRALFWDPAFDRWRDDPQFQQVFTRIGAAEDYKVARATLARMMGEQAGKK